MGCYCRFECIDVECYVVDFYEVYCDVFDVCDWIYFFVGLFDIFEVYWIYLIVVVKLVDLMYYVVIDLVSGKVVGIFVFMCIDVLNGVIEIGSVIYFLCMKCICILMEVMLLLMWYVFEEFGYCCFEWKCDLLNVFLWIVVLCYGFKFEGIFC